VCVSLDLRGIKMTSGLEVARSRLLKRLRQEIKDEAVLRAMEKVPRERFVPPHLQHLAYEDIPLPIDDGQTISQPYIVALMTSALELKGYERVLELGSGSGYQAAILAELAGEVVTVERFSGLASRARATLESLGYQNVSVYEAGESLGWPEDGPYNAIIVTAAAPKVPPTLTEQLLPGGRMVIPVGSRYEQRLLRVRKGAEKSTTEDLGACRFVPLIGEGAWPEEEGYPHSSGHY
jgi:protein-L-isoaspartate(D-aspartate) O-methyltransferase